jgi:multicomponent Na+:H+ antiporter subunit E
MQLFTPRSGVQRIAEKPVVPHWLRLSMAALVFSALWVVLSGYEDPSSWIIGLPAVVAATWAHSRLSSRHRRRLSVMGIVALLPFFLWKSFRGGFDVTRRVVGRRLDVEPGIFEYQLRLTAPSGRILYVSLISLLPGTLSADWQGNRMRIHTLDLRVDAAAELDRLERLVASCFGESLPDRPG